MTEADAARFSAWVNRALEAESILNEICFIFGLDDNSLIQKRTCETCKIDHEENRHKNYSLCRICKNNYKSMWVEKMSKLQEDAEK